MGILVMNGGSSSIKFSIFVGGEAGEAPRSVMEGELSGVGGSSAALEVSGAGAGKRAVSAADTEEATRAVFDAVVGEGMPGVDAVGYRVVHSGAKLTDHQRITPEILDEVEAASAFAPLHGPPVLALIREGMRRFPDAPHFACFDTVFHHSMPEEATTYPLPKKYRDQGVRRYGFHGLSCESIVWQMGVDGKPLPRRMVIAHLGSGCSVTALVDGRSVDTSMGLTPTGGVVMGTRPGDLDPEMVLYLLRQEGDGAAEKVESMLNHEAGLKAISGMANDVKAVREAAGKGDARAVLGLMVFTRSVRKAMGGYAWLLGGLDAVVFSGGIGEHDAATRAEVLAGLEDFGVVLDAGRNSAGGKGLRAVHADGSRTEVLVVPAEEDLMIARHVERMRRDA
jgi:acetate kinase